MLTRLTIVLSEQERAALQAMAEREMRGLREQARYLLRREARQRGLLAAEVGNPDDVGPSEDVVEREMQNNDNAH